MSKVKVTFHLEYILDTEKEVIYVDKGKVLPSLRIFNNELDDYLIWSESFYRIKPFDYFSTTNEDVDLYPFLDYKLHYYPQSLLKNRKIINILNKKESFYFKSSLTTSNNTKNKEVSEFKFYNHILYEKLDGNYYIFEPIKYNRRNVSKKILDYTPYDEYTIDHEYEKNFYPINHFLSYYHKYFEEIIFFKTSCSLIDTLRFDMKEKLESKFTDYAAKKLEIILKKKKKYSFDINYDFYSQNEYFPCNLFYYKGEMNLSNPFYDKIKPNQIFSIKFKKIPFKIPANFYPQQIVEEQSLIKKLQKQKKYKVSNYVFSSSENIDEVKSVILEYEDNVYEYFDNKYFLYQEIEHETFDYSEICCSDKIIDFMIYDHPKNEHDFNNYHKSLVDSYIKNVVESKTKSFGYRLLRPTEILLLNKNDQFKNFPQLTDYAKQKYIYLTKLEEYRFPWDLNRDSMSNYLAYNDDNSYSLLSDSSDIFKFDETKIFSGLRIVFDFIDIPKGLFPQTKINDKKLIENILLKGYILYRLPLSTYTSINLDTNYIFMYEEKYYEFLGHNFYLYEPVEWIYYDNKRVSKKVLDYCQFESEKVNFTKEKYLDFYLKEAITIKSNLHELNYINIDDIDKINELNNEIVYTDYAKEKIKLYYETISEENIVFDYWIKNKDNDFYTYNQKGQVNKSETSGVRLIQYKR